MPANYSMGVSISAWKYVLKIDEVARQIDEILLSNHLLILALRLTHFGPSYTKTDISGSRDFRFSPVVVELSNC